jgi:hypothetical protein
MAGKRHLRKEEVVASGGRQRAVFDSEFYIVDRSMVSRKADEAVERTLWVDMRQSIRRGALGQNGSVVALPSSFEVGPVVEMVVTVEAFSRGLK